MGTATEERPTRVASTKTGAGWAAHPALATAVHAAIVLLPAGGATVLAWTVAGYFGRPDGPAAVGWWAGMLALGTAAYALLERLTRRLLPLAALLRLSLVFPDQTPSRYRVALRSGTTKSLKDVVERARRGEIGDTPAEAAETVLLLTAALNRHDRLTRGHSERVRAYAEVLGAEMGLDADALDRLRWAALLHDVGKLAVPSEVLNKPGKLTAEEFEIIKTHPLEGERLVAPLADWLGDAVSAVGEHHERWDGAGYPRGLAGNDISLAARIVAVADTFDVITSNRSYKQPMPAAEARVEIARCAGTQFDPAVTKALLAVSLGRLWRAGGPLTWLLSVPALANAPVIGGAVTTVGSMSSTMGVAAVVALGGTTMADLARDPGVPNAGQPVAAIVGSADAPAGSDRSSGAGERSSDGDATASTVDQRRGPGGSDGSGTAPTTSVPPVPTSSTPVQDTGPGLRDAIGRLPELLPPSVPRDDPEDDGGGSEESERGEGGRRTAEGGVPGPPGADRPEPPGANRPEPPGANRPEPPGANRPEPPGANRPEPPGANRPEPPGADRPEPPGAGGQNGSGQGPARDR